VDVLYGFSDNSKLFNNNGEGHPLQELEILNTAYPYFYTEQADEKYIVFGWSCLVGMDGNYEMSMESWIRVPKSANV
jgi:hypothetical protein